MMFRSYSNTSEYFLRDYVAIAMAILRLVKTTCYLHVRNNMLFSRVKISRKLTWYFTGVNVINNYISVITVMFQGSFLRTPRSLRFLYLWCSSFALIKQGRHEQATFDKLVRQCSQFTIVECHFKLLVLSSL